MKVVFQYSDIYDDLWKEVMKERSKKSDSWIYHFPFPKEENIMKFVKHLNGGSWPDKQGKRGLKKIESITGLQWKNKQIICYVVGNCIPFSMPMTVFMTWDKRRFFNNVTHELIHVLLYDNDPKLKRFWSQLNHKYNVNWVTFMHIPLFAIHFKMLRDAFGNSAVKAEVEESSSINNSYKKAVQIALKDGDSILKMFPAQRQQEN